jgi:hypothetical protein
MAPRKKRGNAKRQSPAKKSARKSSSKRGRKSTAKSAGSRRATRKRPKAAGGLETVRQVGERTWETLKSTTAHVVEGVKETFGG